MVIVCDEHGVVQKIEANSDIAVLKLKESEDGSVEAELSVVDKLDKQGFRETVHDAMAPAMDAGTPQQNNDRKITLTNSVLKFIYEC